VFRWLLVGVLDENARADRLRRRSGLEKIQAIVRFFFKPDGSGKA
jgi:hypothetical protein